RGAVEAVEDVLAVLGRNPGTVVADAELLARERDVDARAGLRPLAGVLEQVPDRPLDPLLYPFDGRRLAVCVEMHGGEAPACRLDRCFDELVHLHGRALDARIT